MKMRVIPSVDIKSGRAVRLYQGDFDEETVVGADPVEIVRGFFDKGAKEVHIVDLDGALGDKSANIKIIEAICKMKGGKIELGGGIKTLDDIKRAVDLGVDTVVIGSMLADDFSSFEKAANLYKEVLAAALDVKDKKLLTRGWLDNSDISFIDMAMKLEKLNIKRIVVTDINKDGTLTGPNIDIALEIRKIFSREIIVSGGIASYEDLQNVKGSKLTGVIIGKAIYNRNIDLEKALKIGGTYVI